MENPFSMVALEYGKRYTIDHAVLLVYHNLVSFALGAIILYYIHIICSMVAVILYDNLTLFCFGVASKKCSHPPSNMFTPVGE